MEAHLSRHNNGERVSYRAMEKFISNNWSNITMPKMLRKDNGLFVFHFTSEEDLNSILECSPWMMNNHKPIILKRWYEGMELDLSCLSEIPVWINLPNLDVRFWSEHMLARIGSVVGNPLLTDFTSTNQERLSYARVLVEISATMELLRQVRLFGLSDEVVEQTLEYD